MSFEAFCAGYSVQRMRERLGVIIPTYYVNLLQNGDGTYGALEHDDFGCDFEIGMEENKGWELWDREGILIRAGIFYGTEDFSDLYELSERTLNG